MSSLLKLPSLETGLQLVGDLALSHCPSAKTVSQGGTWPGPLLAAGDRSSLPWGGELGGTRRPPLSPPLHAPSVLPASPLAPLGMASPSSGNLSTVRPVLQNTHHSLELVIGLQGVQITPFLTQLTLEPLLSGQPLCGLMQLTCGPIHAPKEPQPLVPIPFSVPAACVQYHPNWMRGHKEMPQGVTWVPTLLFP